MAGTDPHRFGSPKAFKPRRSCCGKAFDRYRLSLRHFSVNSPGYQRTHQHPRRLHLGKRIPILSCLQRQIGVPSAPPKRNVHRLFNVLCTRSRRPASIKLKIAAQHLLGNTIVRKYRQRQVLEVLRIPVLWLCFTRCPNHMLQTRFRLFF